MQTEKEKNTVAHGKATNCSSAGAGSQATVNGVTAGEGRAIAKGDSACQSSLASPTRGAVTRPETAEPERGTLYFASVGVRNLWIIMPQILSKPSAAPSPPRLVAANTAKFFRGAIQTTQ